MICISCLVLCRLDSHLPLPYFITTGLKNVKDRHVNRVIQRVKGHPKKKLVAWFVSHCRTKSDRESYVKELQKHTPVDIYGKCGPLKCGMKKNSVECYKILERDYRFYLSFENSICKDYVTEKIGNILNYDIIPVTLEGANYSLRVPPNSYINALDFSSPRQLAHYLKYLAKNQREYLKYFEWKAVYKVLSKDYSSAVASCKMCSLLTHNISVKSHKNFKSWWYPKDVCKMGNFSFESNEQQ